MQEGDKEKFSKIPSDVESVIAFIDKNLKYFRKKSEEFKELRETASRDIEMFKRFAIEFKDVLINIDEKRDVDEMDAGKKGMAYLFSVGQIYERRHEIASSILIAHSEKPNVEYWKENFTVFSSNSAAFFKMKVDSVQKDSKVKKRPVHRVEARKICVENCLSHINILNNFLKTIEAIEKDIKSSRVPDGAPKEFFG